jgi:hypothetical protein
MRAFLFLAIVGLTLAMSPATLDQLETITGGMKCRVNQAQFREEVRNHMH